MQSRNIPRARKSEFAWAIQVECRRAEEWGGGRAAAPSSLSVSPSLPFPSATVPIDGHHQRQQNLLLRANVPRTVADSKSLRHQTTHKPCPRFDWIVPRARRLTHRSHQRAPDNGGVTMLEYPLHIFPVRYPEPARDRQRRASPKCRDSCGKVQFCLCGSLRSDFLARRRISPARRSGYPGPRQKIDKAAARVSDLRCPHRRCGRSEQQAQRASRLRRQRTQRS